MSLFVSMEEPSCSRSSDTILGSRAAFGIGLAMIASLLVVSLVGWSDRGNVATLETFSESSAVGDINYLAVPGGALSPAHPVLVVNGTPYGLLTNTIQEIRDNRMRRVGIDPSQSLSLYRVSEPTAKEQPAPEGNFVKVDTGRYLPVGPIAARLPGR